MVCCGTLLVVCDADHPALLALYLESVSCVQIDMLDNPFVIMSAFYFDAFCKKLVLLIR